jgi:hypothetical protein
MNKYKFYEAMTVPTLLYGSENWGIEEKEEEEICEVQSGEIKFVNTAKRYIL